MTSWLVAYFPYWGIFILLILGGIGLPFPEDLILILAGQLVHSEELNLIWILTICFAGVLPTDFLLYYAGKKYGRAIWRQRFIRRILTPQRRVQVMDQFKKRGDIVVFIARFIGGFRSPVFITAGILKMSAWRFFLLDFLASLVSIPLFVLGAFYLGQRFSEGAHHIAKKITLYLIISMGVIFVAFVFKIWHAYRKELQRQRN